MSTFELNKILGACLFAGLIAMVAFVVPKELFHSEEGHSEAESHGEASAEGAAAEGGGEASSSESAGAAEEPAVPLGTALVAANADAGAKVFKKCAACHTIEQDGKNKVGPNLWNVVGRERAKLEGFAYSDAMKAMAGTWDLASLDQFVSNPNAYAKGTKMKFAGVKKTKDRADLLLYLNGQNDAPGPLPPAE